MEEGHLLFHGRVSLLDLLLETADLMVYAVSSISAGGLAMLLASFECPDQRVSLRTAFVLSKPNC